MIVGGGLAGLEAALYLGTVLGDDVSITMISNRDRFVYRPFLTYLAFGLSPDRIEIDLEEFATQHGIRLHVGTVESVDPQRRIVEFNGHSLAYDALILATGARSVEEPIPGLRGGHTIWDRADMLRLRERLTEEVERASPERPTRVLFLVPPGNAWSGPVYELAVMTASWLAEQGVRAAFDLQLITAEHRHVEAMGEKVGERVADSLAFHGIHAQTGREAIRVEPGHVVFEEGTDAGFDILINGAVYAGAGPVEGLPVDEEGFYRTRMENRELQSIDRIYAVGDGSDFPVKQGFLALLQADAAAEHIAARILGRDPQFTFTATLFWLMDEFDQVLFARGERDMVSADVDNFAAGKLRRLETMGYLPRQQRLGNPLYSGLLWKGTDIGLSLIKNLESDR
ncbi:MAG: FAD-dependent oxidoreductase [Rhodothermales bacterium]